LGLKVRSFASLAITYFFGKSRKEVPLLNDTKIGKKTLLQTRQLLVFCLLPTNYHDVVLQCCSIISITIKGWLLYHNLGFSLTENSLPSCNHKSKE
jgi:hypothetical protein